MNDRARDFLDDRLLTPNEVADRYRMKPGSLANQRSNGRGPKHIRLPNGRIRYKESALLEWELMGE